MEKDKYSALCDECIKLSKEYPKEIRKDMQALFFRTKVYVTGLYNVGWKPSWPEKLASISFVYKGKKYIIDYNEFGIGLSDQAMIYDIEFLAVDILSKLGAENVCASEFMD